MDSGLRRNDEVPRRFPSPVSRLPIPQAYNRPTLPDENRPMDPFLFAAIEEAEAGLAEGGIPIGSVLVHDGKIIGRGHNRRVQRGSAVLHGEMDALENAGRHPAKVYRAATI